MNILEWNEPESVPYVALGSEKLCWIAVSAVQPLKNCADVETFKTYAFLANYQNRPIIDELDEDWQLYNSDGERVHSVGWVTNKSHHEFQNYYETIKFGSGYKFLGWAEYEPPEFTDNNETDVFKVEQRIIGIEMLIEEFGTRNNEVSLHDYFEITPNEAYDYCDEIYGGDSQHVREKAVSIQLPQKMKKT